MGLAKNPSFSFCIKILIKDMRLLDNIFINLEMLPITDKEKALLENAEFFTKDLHRGYRDYRISDEGFLDLIYWEWEGKGKERQRKIAEYERLDDVHQDVSFFACIYKPNKKSYQLCEFKARFSYGHLDRIIRV